ncbi:hypothetical protein B0H13DRAFT_2412281 [Mycena leptocephala]|nr:hypothetical protein B0H13DRAFT_2412281 [Mycena leptocephala]
MLTKPYQTGYITSYLGFPQIGQLEAGIYLSSVNTRVGTNVGMGGRIADVRNLKRAGLELDIWHLLEVQLEVQGEAGRREERTDSEHVRVNHKEETESQTESTVELERDMRRRQERITEELRIRMNSHVAITQYSLNRWRAEKWVHCGALRKLRDRDEMSSMWSARSRPSTTWISNQGVQVWSADGDPEGGSWGVSAEMKREEREGKKSGPPQRLQWILHRQQRQSNGACAQPQTGLET